MTALADYQIRIGSFLLGPGTPYGEAALEGLGRDIRGNDQDRPNASGAVIGQDYSAAKTVLVGINIAAGDAAAAMVLYDALAAAWNVASLTEGRFGLTTLYWKLPGQAARRLDGRPRRLVPSFEQLAHGFISVVGEFYAPDPRMLAHDLGLGPTGERIVDLDIGATVTVENDGNHPAAVWYDVYGAVTNPGLIRDEAARFDLAATIANGTYYRLRTDQKTVTKSTGGSNQYPAFSGTWLEVPPGGAVFRAVGTSPGANAKIRLTYRDTWL